MKRIRKYVNPELLLIDEMGHDRLELEVTREAHLLFKVIDERYKQNKNRKRFKEHKYESSNNLQ